MEDMNLKLKKLKEEHNSLSKEYGEIYVNGTSYSEQELLRDMRPIEETFRTLGMNVFTYEIKE